MQFIINIHIEKGPLKDNLSQLILVLTGLVASEEKIGRFCKKLKY
jgi:hypothetical protein